MKLSPNQTDEAALTRFGEEAIALVQNKEFSVLAEYFGYALAFGRNPSTAIEDDFAQCLSEASGPSSQFSRSIEVKYFKSNSIPLFALVECVIPISQGMAVLLELVVAGDGAEKHITLEQISYVT